MTARRPSDVDEQGGRPLMAHATALLVGSAGVLLRGPSGSGKSSLTRDLIERAGGERLFARLIGDDRVEIANRHGRLVARPHPRIAGAIEERGLGILSVPYEPAGVIRCVVDLSKKGAPAPQRYPLDELPETKLCGVTVPRLRIDAFETGAVRRIFSFIHEFVAF